MADLIARWRDAGLAHLSLFVGAMPPDLGCPWPANGRLSVNAALTLANIAPNTVMAISDGNNAQFATSLGARCGDAIAITDQSSAYRVLVLEGPRATEILASGIFVDLDPGVLPPGSSTALRCGQIAVILLRRGDDTFDLLVPRSYADYFMHWLDETARLRRIALAVS